MLEMLPESEQEFASQFIKRLVLAWDPDFTKLTNEEQERLEAAEQRIILLLTIHYRRVSEIVTTIFHSICLNTIKSSVI